MSNRIAVFNDNNYPFSVGRHAGSGAPDDNEMIIIELAEPLRRLRSIGHDVIVVGTRAQADLARRCGVRVTGVVSAPLGVPVLARNPLAAAIDLSERAETDVRAE